jgi:hypothetical protein
MLKKKKQSKADFLRSWGITDPKRLQGGFSWLRYKNPPEKGIYWYYFSLYVRQRDVEKYGVCISCGRPITVDTCDAGHFIPAGSGGRDLLFDPLNVNAECSRCNAWDASHLFGYERGLIERYGAEVPIALKRQYFDYKNGGVVKDFKPEEYAALIRKLSTYKHPLQTVEELV